MFKILKKKCFTNRFHKTVSLLDDSQDGIICMDLQGIITFWNSGAESIYGYSAQEAIGKSISLIHYSNLDFDYKELYDQIYGGQTLKRFETVRKTKEDKKIIIYLSLSPIRDYMGNITGISGITRDITEQKRLETQLFHNYQELNRVHQQLGEAEKALQSQLSALKSSNHKLKLSEERYELAIHASSDGFGDWNLKTDEIFYSKRFIRMLGYSQNAFHKQSLRWLDFIHPDDYFNALSSIDKYLNKEIPEYKCQYRILHKEGYYIWVECNAIAKWDHKNRPLRLIFVQKNINEQKEKNEKVFHMAYYDTLTGLPNRRLFGDQLELTLREMKKTKSCGAIFFLDLDNFKNVNDTLGHEVGDQLLKEVSKALQEQLDDVKMISRFGGDEFLILIENCNENEIYNYAKKILKIFETPFTILEGINSYITASIGASLFPLHGSNIHELLKKSDAAMYKAKHKGKNTFGLYNSDMSKELFSKLRIENALRDALTNNEFTLHYQPQYDVNTCQIVSLECLLRWKNKKLGSVSPMDFIPIAEETHIIIDIGEWVLKSACQQAVKWLNEGYVFDKIAVNISPKQLQADDFVNRLLDIINFYQLPAHYLELEITETSLMDSLDLNVQKLNVLVNYGFKIALDDFGTGYSSLNYLKNLPISTLKVDRSFLQDMRFDTKENAIVEGIIHLSHKLNMEVVAEGVETMEQFDLLCGCQCDKIQGYYFAKPTNANEVVKLLKNQRRN